eukprot:PhF_6_TR8756/c0_g2_i2/m.13809
MIDPSQLSKPLRFISKHVYEELLHTEDTAMDKMRKFAIAMAFLSTPGGYLVSIAFILLGYFVDVYEYCIVGILWFLAALLLTVTWIRVKRTKRFTPLLVETTIYCVSIMVFLGYIAIKHELFIFLLLATTISGALVQPVYENLFIALNSCFLLIWGYNNCIPKMVPEATLLLLPNLFDPQAISIPLSILGLVTNFLLYWVVSFRNKAFLSAITRANAAKEMCGAVTKSLTRYDTDGAKQSLEALRQHGMEATDPDTYNALVNLVGNLEKYRPHLPNYVLEESVDTEDDDVHTLEVSCKRVSKSFTPSGSLGEFVGLVSVHSPAHSPARSEVLEIENTPNTPTAIEVDQPQSASFLFLAPAQEKIHDVTKAAATVIVAWEDGCQMDGALYEASMTLFVNRMHALANPTQATIHGFVGDTVHLSWNTSRKVVQHQTKGALFLSWMQRDSGDETVRTYGAVSTGPARTFYAGDRHSMLLVQTEWDSRVAALHDVAVKYTSTVICQSVFDCTKPFVESRWVDAIAYDGGNRLENVYELLGERQGG